MSLDGLRYANNEEEEMQAILEFEETTFGVMRIVTIIINWCFLPFILLSLALTNFTAMTILAIIWVTLVILWVVGVHVYKFGVMQDWWDNI